ncbi:MAG: transposase [Candidatus Accumulibacter sp.]|jgi:hypothetical protein|nr:transposase [Candidatus Accumulibacter necessarius]
MLGWLMVSKYAGHLPLYYLERQAARAAVTLSRSTLADCLGRTGIALEPLWRRLCRMIDATDGNGSRGLKWQDAYERRLGADHFRAC